MHPNVAGPNALQFLGFPYLRSHLLTENYQIWHDYIYGKCNGHALRDQSRHCIYTNVLHGLSVIAKFLVKHFEQS